MASDGNGKQRRPDSVRRRALETVLGRLDKVRRTGKGWMARCPAHPDKTASLSIGQGRDGRVLLRCFAGCKAEEVVARLGLTMRDLFEDGGGTGQRGGGPNPPDLPATTQPNPPGGGLTLARYAEAKRLPLDFLRGLGLSQIALGQPAVRIPYLDRDGSEVAARFRMALEGENRFRWRRGAKPCLYGLQRLKEAEAAGYVVLNEGESDTQTCWLHTIPAVGLPGASSWREAWADHLDAIPTIYVIVEPDQGGQATLKWLATSRIRDRARLVRLGDAKDPSGLYLAEPGTFAQRFRAALEASVAWTEHAAQEADERRQEAWERCQALAHQERILDRFAEAVAAAGVAGESRIVKLIYLVVTSRLLERPISLGVKGPSSGGKSYLVEQVLGFFPPSAYYALTAMSEHALAYSKEPLVHRMLVLYEAAALESNFVTYLVRSLLSEGRIRYETVEKTSDGLKPRLIEREGPTGLLLTTTKVHLHPENETRMISITVTDTPEQTHEVLLALAEEVAVVPDCTAWHGLQEWLEGGERRVVVPFGRSLAEAVPPVAVRLRRDFGVVLNLIRAHALLHQANREHDAKGRIIATLDDYAAVRELVADLVSEGVDATVPETVRATVEAVRELQGSPEEGVTVTAVMRIMKLDKPAAWRRVQISIHRGYLKNLETRKFHAARLVTDEPMPEEVDVLPSPEALGRLTEPAGEGCTVAGDPEGIGTPLPPEAADWSEEQRDAYEERLAIMIVEGGLPEDEAREKALEYIRRVFGGGDGEGTKQ